MKVFTYGRDSLVDSIENLSSISSEYCLSCLDGIVDEIEFLSKKEDYVLVGEKIESFYGSVSAVWAVPKKHIGDGYEEVPVSSIPRLVPTDFTDAFDLCGKAMIRRPLHAEPFMNGIDGDGSALSYLAASILARAILDLEAGWHGIVWSAYVLLYEEPWKLRVGPRGKTIISEEKWDMKELPERWGPEIIFDKGTVTVRFHTYTGMGRRRIHEFTDTYAQGSYAFKTKIREIGRAPGGYMV